MQKSYYLLTFCSTCTRIGLFACRHGKGPVALTDPEADAAVQREISVLKKEKKEEEDDEETLRNARQWDDWKDGRCKLYLLSFFVICKF